MFHKRLLIISFTMSWMHKFNSFQIIKKRLKSKYKNKWRNKWKNIKYKKKL
jgi:hypothetical protein